MIPGRKPSTDTAKAIKTANPPAVGIGTLLMRRALGLSTAPILKDRKRTSGVATADKTRVEIRTMMYCRANGIMSTEPFSTPPEHLMTIGVSHVPEEPDGS